MKKSRTAIAGSGNQAAIRKRFQTEEFWHQKVDYLHNNPCRKGLVCRADHWRFSSAAWHISDGVQTPDVPLAAIVW
ncbi:MAG TPA: hypothetical protein VHZ24_06560 [Pirellulales bacterium]|jgi:hypothetical protein|nr:hypothetical protein [Pirellulales bacterium]